MRGRPWIEILLVVFVGVMLLVPLQQLTQIRSRVSPSANEFDLEQGNAWIVTSAWLDVRFSHAPLQFEVMEGARSLGEGGGDSRWDEDADLHLSDGSVQLRITGEFPADVDSAYLEMRVEPEGLPAQQSGVWTRGTFSHHLEFRWSEN